MWKSATKAFSEILFREPCFLTRRTCLQEQIRTTFILKRRYAPQLHKKGSAPKKLRSRHYVYELIKDTFTEKQPNIDVILTSYVDGLGNVGEKVSVTPQYAYNHLILPGLAVYATKENIEEFKNPELESQPVERYSSSTALLTVKTLSRITLSVVMNKENPWTIQPWHIKACFRKCGYVVPEDSISLPEKPIKGPDMDLENKEFFVNVTVNNAEKVNVRCRLHHWSTNIVDRIPHVERFWTESTDPVYPEFAKVLGKIPKKGENVDVKQLDIQVSNNL